MRMLAAAAWLYRTPPSQLLPGLSPLHALWLDMEGARLIEEMKLHHGD